MRYVILLACLLACRDGGTTPDDDSGTDDSVGPSVPQLTVPEAAYGIPNNDDDNLDGTPDWQQENPEDADLTMIEIGANAPLLAQVDTIRLSLSTQFGSLADLRVYHDGSLLLSETQTQATLPAADLTTVSVEFAAYISNGDLTVEVLSGESVVDSRTIPLMSSPLILNHHLQTATEVMIVGLQDENAAMRSVYAAELGDGFRAIPGRDYFDDPWLQDEIEFATAVSPDHTLDVCIDSIRDRGLDDLPENQFFQENWAIGTWGGRNVTSQDSFGNLEVSPPIEGYPFGRVYYGNAGGNLQVTQRLRTFLDNQRVQEPFEVDVSFLCVGHIDEYTTFIPDPSAPRGFRFVINDVDAAYDVLESMDPDTSLTRYQPFRTGHGIDTVRELLEDDDIRGLNEQLRDYYIEPALETFTEELALTEEEIIRLPGLFEIVPACGGTTAALIPGMANLVVANFDNEPTKLFIADPYLREDVSATTDPMIEAVRDLMPEGIEASFVDDWFTYHIGLGEVHCGTNVVRAPSSVNWWDHLDQFFPEVSIPTDGSE